MEIVELYDNGAPGIEGSEAERFCEKAAEAGDEKAIARLEDGFDTRPLIEIMKEQAEKGNADAMWWMYGSALDRHCPDEAQLWYDKALEAGQGDALLAEADKYLRKDEDSYDPRLAEQYLRRGADKGNIAAITRLGKLELNGGDEDFWQAAMKKEQDDFEATPERLERHKRQFAWVKLAAEAGDDESMYQIALAYHFGYPTEKDEEEAFQMAAAAAKQGNYSAMYLASWLMENGLGTERDLDTAVALYAVSTEGGIVPAMLRLYEIYKDGYEHIPADKEKAHRYLWMSGVGHD